MILASCLFLLLHCAPGVGTVPPRAKIVPAAKASSAIPTLEQVRAMNARADQHGSSASGKVTSAKSGMQASTTEIQSLAREVSRLHQQKSATENELLAVYNRLVEQQRKFSVMVSDLTAAENDLSAERALRLQSAEALVAAQSLATRKEAEAEHLRSQLAHESLVADNYAQAADANAQLAAANAARADKAAGTISSLRRVILILGILTALSVVLNVLQFKTGIL